MVERYRRGKKKNRLLGNHQKCWIWGKNAVGETLRAGFWQVHELRLSDALPETVMLATRKSAAKLDIPVIAESPTILTKRCGSAEHQGFLAKMTPFPYSSPDELIARMHPAPLYVILDSIQDPYNFGAIVRSADVLAADAIVIGDKHQVGVTSLVARSSAGAVNHIPIARTDDLADVITQLQSAGVCIVATEQAATTACQAHDWRRPTAVIIGNEGTGVTEQLLSFADERVTIPQAGHVDSLNAAVAAGILLYEARRQRTFNNGN